jgi:hypothetical protein
MVAAAFAKTEVGELLVQLAPTIDQRSLPTLTLATKDECLTPAALVVT